MKKICNILTISFVLSVLFFSCTKKPLTFDSETSIKTLLNASDEDLAELAIKEAVEKGDLEEEDLSVEYILRDPKSQAIAIKLKINE